MPTPTTLMLGEHTINSTGMIKNEGHRFITLYYDGCLRNSVFAILPILTSIFHV
jgi:hypothetical protein